MREVCPNCDALLDECYDPTEQNDEQCWVCPNCSETWIGEELYAAYGLEEGWGIEAEDE